MRPIDLTRLLVLAALWGGSFLFMRIAAPVLGALWTAEARVGLAGAAMVLWVVLSGRSLQVRQHWRPYLVLGVLNSALPFVLFSWAALTLPAGYSAILNATSPLWGAAVAALWLGDRLTVRKAAGLVTGVVGVAFLVRLGPLAWSTDVLLAALACVSASLCYGIAGAYSKKTAPQVAPPLLATGSQLAAAFVLLPFAPFAPLRSEPTWQVIGAVVALALLCSAVAYFLYYRLIADVGPTRALTVTFLIPLFAIAWGALFLGEAVTLYTLLGGLLVLVATALVVFSGPGKATAAPRP